MAVQNVEILGKTYTGAVVPPEVTTKLTEQLNAYIGLQDSEIKQVFTSRFDALEKFLSVILNKLDNPAFGGIYPDTNQLGFSLIRPSHVGRTDWDVSWTSAGWIDYIGTSSAPYQMSDEAGVVAIGIVSYAPQPIVDALKVTIGDTSYVPYVVKPIQLKDNKNNIAVYPIPTLAVTPKNTVYVQLHSDKVGDDEVALVGLTYGLGSYLTK